MTEAQYYRKIRRAKRKAECRKRLYEINQEQKKYKTIETSKAMALYLFALLNVIVVYAMVAMWHFSDLAALTVLIADIAAQVLLYGIYCLKAYKGKKAKEDLAFEREKFNGTPDTISEIIDAGVDESLQNDYIN